MNKLIKCRLTRVVPISIVWLVIAAAIAQHETFFFQYFEGVFENTFLVDYSLEKTLDACPGTTIVGAISIGLLKNSKSNGGGDYFNEIINN